MYQVHLNTSRLSRLLFSSVLVLAVLGSMLIALPRDASQAAEDLPAALDLSTIPLAFVVNAGQSDTEVAFHAQSPGVGLYFTAGEVVFSLPMPDDASFVTRMAYAGAETSQVSGYNPQPGVYNFFLGNDPDQWYTNVPTFAGVRYHNLYPGIDLRFEGTMGMLESTYTVAPGADPRAIAYRYVAAQQTTIDVETGNLRILLYTHDEYGDMAIAETAPIAWQTIDGAQVPVDIRFAMTEAGLVRFDVGDYNTAYPLIIDPIVQYSTYFGGGGPHDDIGYDIVADDSGNGYLAGQSNAPNLPLKNALQNFRNGSSDAFIAKLNVSISSQTLIYGTYLGGSQQEEAHGITLDANGNIYVTGKTTSTDFPLTGSPYQGTYGQNGDAFVTKITADGSALSYSTYLGGNAEDMGRAIAVDASGNAYITGFTKSINFPRVNEIQTSRGGTQDAFLTKLTGDGSGAMYSTYLGGTGIEEGLDVDFDIVNQPYVVGYTTSADFPTSALAPNTPFQATNAGGTDGFVTKFLADGSAHNFSTYFGGTGTDQVTGVVVDPTGSAFITGWTTSTNVDFPTTGNALQSNNAGGEDAFISSLSVNGDAVNYSTFLGGSTSDKASGITQDSQGIVHVAGETFSSDFLPLGAPTISPAGGYSFDTLHGASDAFAAALDLSTNSFFYAAYIGGSGTDIAHAIAVDSGGGIYITGQTNSGNFPVVNEAYQYAGYVDAFMVKIGSAQADLVIEKTSDVPEVLVGENVTYFINVTNDGPADTGNVVFEDTVPVEAAVQSINATPGTTCFQAGQLITCETSLLAFEETATVTIVAQATVKGTVENTAQITESAEFDPDTSATSNTSTATVIFYKDANLSIDVSASTHRPEPNQTIDLIVEVTNLGLAPDANVVVADNLPTGQLAYVTHSATQGSYNQGSGVWTIGAMARDQVETLTITVTIGNHTAGTEIPYPASVSGVENDPDPLNNADTADLVVVGPDFPPYGCYPSETDPDVIICITGNGD